MFNSEYETKEIIKNRRYKLACNIFGNASIPFGMISFSKAVDYCKETGNFPMFHTLIGASAFVLGAFAIKKARKKQELLNRVNKQITYRGIEIENDKNFKKKENFCVSYGKRLLMFASAGFIMRTLAVGANHWVYYKNICNEIISSKIIDTITNASGFGFIVGGGSYIIGKTISEETKKLTK